MPGPSGTERAVAGRYVLEEALPPRAGVARWHARDRLLERPVMVGEVRLDPGMDEAERARASRAAGRATGIQVLDVVCEGDRLYVVTPAETPVTEFATLETPTVVVAEPTAVLPFAAPPLASAAARRRRSLVLVVVIVVAVVGALALLGTSSKERRTTQVRSPASSVPVATTVLAPTTALPPAVRTPVTAPPTTVDEQVTSERGDSGGSGGSGSGSGGFNPNDYG